MEEIKIINKKRNTKDNFFPQAHKSVQFNQINSTKIIPNFLNNIYKVEGTSDNIKETNNLKMPRPSNIVSRNDNLSFFHSNSIKSPDYLNKLMKNKIRGTLNNINTEEVLKLNETSKNN